MLRVELIESGFSVWGHVRTSNHLFLNVDNQAGTIRPLPDIDKLDGWKSQS